MTVVPFTAHARRQLGGPHIGRILERVLLSSLTCCQGGDVDIDAIEALGEAVTSAGWDGRDALAIERQLAVAVGWLDRAHATATVHALADDGGWQAMSGSELTERAVAIAGAIEQLHGIMHELRIKADPAAWRAQHAEGFWAVVCGDIE